MFVTKEQKVSNFQTLIAQAARKWPNRNGLIFDQTGEAITFQQIHDRVNQISQMLMNQGIEKGSKVALMLPNIAEFPLTWLSLGVIGGVMIPMNIRYQTHDTHYVLHHSETSLVMTISEKVELLHQIREEHQLSFKIITVDKPHELAEGYLYHLLSTQLIEVPETQIFPESLVNIQYTSGTTGFPKGCMLSQNYWLNIGKKIAHKPFPGLTEQDILLTAQPYYYMDPQWNTIATLMTGATLVVLDRFSPSTFFQKIRQYHVTFFYCLGSMPVLLLKIPETIEDRNHHLRYVACSAIPAGLHAQLEKRWGVKWFEIFGMTETGYDISMTLEEHDDYVGKGALGRPTYDREARVMDEHDQPVSLGETGELVLRGVGMMEGYFKNEEATKEVFKNGWFHTGDLVRADENGVLYYVGRKKDMIRRSGENISAVEVEEVIMSHPSVKVAACIPIEDEIRGEEIKVYVVPAVVSDSFLQVLIDHCKVRLATFKIPRYWEIKPELPLTPSERVAKHLLKQEKENILQHSYDRIEKKWYE